MPQKTFRVLVSRPGCCRGAGRAAVPWYPHLERWGEQTGATSPGKRISGAEGLLESGELMARFPFLLLSDGRSVVSSQHPSGAAWSNEASAGLGGQTKLVTISRPLIPEAAGKVSKLPRWWGGPMQVDILLVN